MKKPLRNLIPLRGNWPKNYFFFFLPAFLVEPPLMLLSSHGLLVTDSMLMNAGGVQLRSTENDKTLCLGNMQAGIYRCFATRWTCFPFALCKTTRESRSLIMEIHSLVPSSNLDSRLQQWSMYLTLGLTMPSAVRCRYSKQHFQQEPQRPIIRSTPYFFRFVALSEFWYM